MFGDAESRMPALIAANGGNAMFFKMKDDPRVTRVASSFGRPAPTSYPQFFNVPAGAVDQTRTAN